MLIGEWSLYNFTVQSPYTTDDVNLNSLCAALGMAARFDTGKGLFDATTDVLAPVNTNNYLMAGVAGSGMWDSKTDYFVDSAGNPWVDSSGNAPSLVYIHDLYYSSPSELWPQVVRKTPRAKAALWQSHDSNVVSFPFDDTLDTLLNRNFRFVHNLCAIYPPR